MYCIKKGYKCNPKFVYVGSEWNSANFQIAVYEFAAKIIREKGLKSVLDIGCGRGTKLLKYICPVCDDIMGIDINKSDDWLVDDIENPTLILNRKFDAIICSDVIEHLVDPDKLFPYIRKFSNPETFIVLSTPNRIIYRGQEHFGPPHNESHVREWSKEEFEEYICYKSLEILESFTAEDSPKGTKGCMVYLVKWRNE